MIVSGRHCVASGRLLVVVRKISLLSCGVGSAGRSALPPSTSRVSCVSTSDSFVIVSPRRSAPDPGRSVISSLFAAEVTFSETWTYSRTGGFQGGASG